jgi:hypothetical protein
MAPVAPRGTLDPADLSDTELLGLWAAVMEELRRRGVVRSSNNPVADYAERLVADRLGLELAANSTAGYDAVGSGPGGARYQIKARRLTGNHGSRQLSAIRNLDGDGFDYLVAALFDAGFNLAELWKLPIALVREHATYRAHVNAHVLHVRGAVLADPRAERLA